MNKFHTIKSFIKSGFKERSTWVGISIILFGIFYHKEINQLIINILGSNELVTSIIDTLATFVGALLIAHKDK